MLLVICAVKITVKVRVVGSSLGWLVRLLVSHSVSQLQYSGRPKIFLWTINIEE